MSALLRREVAAAVEDGTIDSTPPHPGVSNSIVDATVSTAAVVRDLFDQLRGTHHELVVFDMTAVPVSSRSSDLRMPRWLRR